MKKIVMMSLFFIIFLTGCNDKTNDFKVAKWGMSPHEVIALEKENGNDLFSEDFFDTYFFIEYEDLMIDGLRADVEYRFSKEVDKLIFFSSEKFKKAYEKVEKKLENDELTDEEKIEIQEQFEEDNKELFDQFHEMPDMIKLSKNVLTAGEYWFSDIDEGDREVLFNTLVSKYGDPIYGELPYDKEEYYSWDTGRTTISLSGRSISYYANYEALKDYMLINNKKKKTNDTDL